MTSSPIGTVIIGGGQSGLAAAHAMRRAGLKPVLLEASDTTTGSWQHYYDSLTLFSPARYSSLPGMPFPGDPGRYPTRDEVVDYLTTYSAALDVDVRLRHTVVDVAPADGGFAVQIADRQTLHARTVVAASGSFSNPHVPKLPDLDHFTGTVLHAADYRTPELLAAQRVIVVGAGNSAIQIAVELAERAHTTLATRAPVRYAPQRPLGRDLHFWLTITGLDSLPIGRFRSHPPTVPVLDTGRYRKAVEAGHPGWRPLWTAIEDQHVTWPDGTHERIDTIVLATGYRPALPYLARIGALDESGMPRHKGGLSTTHPGLAYLGLEWQRSMSSNTLRGVGSDARHIAKQLRHTRPALTAQTPSSSRR